MSEPTLDEKIIKGINASPGICIGKAYIVDKEGVDVVGKYYIPGKKKRQKEIKRFKAAVKKARDELRSIIENSPEELQHAHILETHMALLKDKSLYGKTVETIENEKVNAEWALKTVVSNLKAIFQSMTDSYIKERASDIVHVSDLFTTFARIAGATEHIPRDRVIDGLDQTALLLEGESHGRRDYVYIYESQEAALPEFHDVLDRVRNDWAFAKREEASRKVYGEIRSRYRVLVEGLPYDFDVKG